MRRIIFLLSVIILSTFAATTTLEISGDKLILSYPDSRQPVIFRREGDSGAQAPAMKIDIPGTWTLNTNPPAKTPVKTPDTLRNALWPGIVGAPYSYSLKADGKSARWSVKGLPKGLRVSQNGTISGKPSEAGTFSVEITAETRTGKSTQNFQLKIFADAIPRIITTNLPKASVNAPYDFRLKLNDSPAPFLMAANFPDGLTLDDSGRIHGKVSKPGDYTLGITAANDAGESTSALTLKVTSRDISAPKPAPAPAQKPAPAPRNNLRITTSAITQAFTDEEYSFTLKASGNPPVTWKADKLPEGLSLNSETGIISGTPSSDFRGRVTFTATNKDGSISRTIPFNVRTKKPRIITSLLPEAFAGLDYRTELQAEGGRGITWEFRGNIPDGLSFSKSGVIEGVPEKIGRFTLNASAVNSGGKASRRLTLRVSEAAKLDYVTAAVIPAFTASADGKHDFTVSIDAKIPAGSYIEWHSFPYGLESDGDNYTFTDSNGKDTITVPANHSVTVSAILEGGVRYEPVITARVKEKIAEPASTNTNASTSTDASFDGVEITGEIQGSYSGCNAAGVIGAVIFLFALMKKSPHR